MRNDFCVISSVRCPSSWELRHSGLLRNA